MTSYFAHITENALISINKYGKPGFYQTEDTELFDSNGAAIVITIKDCDNEMEAAQRLKHALENGEFLQKCSPKPTTEQCEELCDSIDNYILNFALSN